MATDMSASICSVTFMLPIVAAMAEPARAVTMRAVSTGASSRVRLSATSEPTRFSLPKRTST